LLLSMLILGFSSPVYAGIVSEHYDYHDPYYNQQSYYYQYASQPQSQIQGIPISISNFQYNPHDIIIAEGTTVSWVNYDSAPHTVTSDNYAEDRFDSGKSEYGQVYTKTFSKAGTFYYYCAFHPNMRGVIRVIAPDDGYYYYNPPYQPPYHHQQVSSYYMYPVQSYPMNSYPINSEPMYGNPVAEGWPPYSYSGGNPDVYYSEYSNQQYEDSYYYNTSQVRYGY
jgi:plastocyanin